MTQSSPTDGWVGCWSPGIGDPTFMGWFTAFAYLATAYLCFRAGRRLRASAGRRIPAIVPFIRALSGQVRRLWSMPVEERMHALWSGMTLLMVFLGLNKQLDLQTALTEVGRMMAQSQGWYEVRAKVQLAFIGCVLIVGIWLFAAVLALARGDLRRAWPMVAGTVFLICFVAIRAASFHHIDRFIGIRLAGMRMNWILELGGIGLVAYGAVRAGAVGWIRYPHVAGTGSGGSS
jgi:hypothetical protein